MRYGKPLLLAAALALALSATAPGAAAQARPQEPATPACAWQPLGYRTSNVAYPDTHTQYWLLHYTKQDGLAITLEGRYPDARYASFTSYDARHDSFTGPDGSASVLADHRIAPDRGSANPFEEPARAGGKYTVTVTDEPVRRPNVLPLSPPEAPEGAAGTVIYRVYLPEGEVRLP